MTAIPWSPAAPKRARIPSRKIDAHGELLLGRGGEVQALEHLRRDGVLGQGADAALDVTQELGEFLLGGGVHEFLDEEMAGEGTWRGGQSGGAHSAYTDSRSSGVPYLSRAWMTRLPLWLLAMSATLPLQALKMETTSARLSAAEIFLTRSRSQRATISWMSVKLGFWSAFCWLDHSFCSLRVVATCLGASECFLEVSPPAPEAVESPPPDSRFASLSPLDLLRRRRRRRPQPCASC